ncbi:MAG: hypothetical protein SGILL_008074 [Bacillariaceae sp.]
MKFSSAPMISFLLLAVALCSISNVEGKCHVYFYQSGAPTNTSVSHYYVYAWDHDDKVCGDYSSVAKLEEGEWESVSANKDHESTIQVYFNTEYTGDSMECGAETGLDGNYCSGEIYTCDGSMTSNGGCGMSKATCWDRYIIYANNDNLVCKAATDDDGNALTDDNGDPYCAEDGDDCETIYYSQSFF